MIKCQNQYWVTQTPTFGELVAVYANDGKPKKKCTLVTYQYLLAKYILPRWGDVKADKITPLAVGKWIDDLYTKVNSATCAKVAMTVSAVFRLAKRTGLCLIPNSIKRRQKIGGNLILKR